MHLFPRRRHRPAPPRRAAALSLFPRPRPARQGYGGDMRARLAGTGRYVYENFDPETGEGYGFSSEAQPMYSWGALAGFIGLQHAAAGADLLPSARSVYTSSTCCGVRAPE